MDNKNMTVTFYQQKFNLSSFTTVRFKIKKENL